jgi:hypothetical protein
MTMWRRTIGRHSWSMCPESGCLTNLAFGMKRVERRRRAEIHSPREY